MKQTNPYVQPSRVRQVVVTPENRAEIERRAVAQFQPLVEKYRKDQQLTLIALLLITSIWGVSAGTCRVSGNVSFWFPIIVLTPFFALLLVLVLGYENVRLICPICASNLEYLSVLGKHCPECGEPIRIRKGFFQTPECLNCRADLSIRKCRRRFKIKHCTHCGVLLTHDPI